MNAPVPAAQLRAWMTQRDELIAWMNSPNTPDLGGADEEIGRLNRLDAAIIDSPADSLAGNYVRLLTAAKISAEGSTLSDEDSAKLVCEAAALLGKRAADQALFHERLAEYRRVRAISDALQGNGEQEDNGRWTCDRLVDDYCAAMDRLVEDTIAPTVGALRIKLALIAERDFCSWPEAVAKAIDADLDYLEAAHG